MTRSIREGIRSLIRAVDSSDTPPTGERALVARADGWYDRSAAGVETRMGGPWLEQILTADYTNATTTGTDVFAGFTPAANTRYLVDVLLSVQSNAATTGVQLALAGPTTGITRVGAKLVTASAATTDLVSNGGGLNVFQAATAGLAAPNLATLQAIIQVGTPGAGNIRVQARTEATLTSISIWPGSSMRWRVI